MEVAGSHNRVAMRDYYEIHQHGDAIHTMNTEQLYELRAIALADWRHAEFRRFFNVGMLSLVVSNAGLFGIVFWRYLHWDEAPGQNFLSLLTLNSPLVSDNWMVWIAMVLVLLASHWQARYARASQTLTEQSKIKLQYIDAELMRRRRL